MQQERWHRLEAAFEEALDLDPAARAAYLDQIDSGLRSEVESMLAAAAAGPGVLRDVVAPGDPILGHAFGPYRIHRLLGRGGMGAVYEAERADQAFSRHVAIKVLRAESIEGSAGRFRQERQILAARPTFW